MPLCAVATLMRGRPTSIATTLREQHWGEVTREQPANTANAVPHFIQRRVLHIVFASTSGHTEYVVDALTDSLKSITPGWEIEATIAEKTQPQDLLTGDVLLLASSTWNTGSVEGQLNPHMWVLLHDKAKTSGPGGQTVCVHRTRGSPILLHGASGG